MSRELRLLKEVLERAQGHRTSEDCYVGPFKATNRHLQAYVSYMAVGYIWLYITIYGLYPPKPASNSQLLILQGNLLQLLDIRGGDHHRELALLEPESEALQDTSTH